MRLISACLLGISCAWDGRNTHRSDSAAKLLRSDVLMTVCPEQLGRLRTLRARQEIQGGTGEDVLDGKCRVLNSGGEDVTQEFITGAEETLKIVKLFHIEEFIGKSRSPSCGCGQIYDGTLSGEVIKGDGVTTALLKRNGIRVITEEGL